jgi:hypothetical protein
LPIRKEFLPSVRKEAVIIPGMDRIKEKTKAIITLFAPSLLEMIIVPTRAIQKPTPKDSIVRTTLDHGLSQTSLTSEESIGELTSVGEYSHKIFGVYILS